MIKFTSTKLASKGKAGILKPDADGYYTMVIGGLNMFNSVGEYYTADGARQLFEQSSTFMRRMQNGCLKGELGHPKRLPGMSMDDYLRRIITIEETNVCCHFKEVWLDEQYGKNHPELRNPSLIAIMAKVKPAGPKGSSLKESFDNPSENVCFSIRAFTKDYAQHGKTIRVLDQIMTFDQVVEPGLHIANKWDIPSLEALTDCIITKAQITKVVSDQMTNVATEDSKQLAQALLASFDVSQPLYTYW